MGGTRRPDLEGAAHQLAVTWLTRGWERRCLVIIMQTPNERSGRSVSTAGSSALRIAGVVSVVAGTIAVTQPARADTELGADLNLSVPLASDDDKGVGVALRLGHRFSIPFVHAALELKGGFDSYSGPRDPSVYTGLAGARFGIGEIIRPSAYAHIGIGHLDFGPEVLEDRTRAAADVGVALDFTLLPLLDLGVHGEYGALVGADYDWLRFGIHALLVF